MNKLDNIKTVTLEKNSYYFLLPWGLGDSMIFCGFKAALEKKLGGKIVPVVKPSHELIMKMYGIRTYVLVSMDATEEAQHNLLCDLARKCPAPNRGQIYVAHPEFHSAFHYLIEEMGNPSFKTKFLRWYRDFFGLSDSEKLQLPVWYPEVAESLEERVRKLTGLSCKDVILVLPEATSANGISPSSWKEFLQSLPQKKLLTNINHIENFPEFQEIPNIKLSLEEVTALALHCAKVYAVRSGLCDLIFSKGRGLHVFYPTRNIYSVFELKSIFAIPGIHESILEDEFEGLVHVTPNLRHKRRLGLFRWVECSKIHRYSFFGINLISVVEK